MPVDILGAVAVMAIGIDNGNPLLAIMLPDPLDHYRLDIDIAEAAVPLNDLHRMVAGRADQGKGMLGLPLQYQPGGLDGPTC